jgi:hypothetical protein
MLGAHLPSPICGDGERELPFEAAANFRARKKRLKGGEAIFRKKRKMAPQGGSFFDAYGGSILNAS